MNISIRSVFQFFAIILILTSCNNDVYEDDNSSNGQGLKVIDNEFMRLITGYQYDGLKQSDSIVRQFCNEDTCFNVVFYDFTRFETVNIDSTIEDRYHGANFFSLKFDSLQLRQENRIWKKSNWDIRIVPGKNKIETVSVKMDILINSFHGFSIYWENDQNHLHSGYPFHNQREYYFFDTLRVPGYNSACIELKSVLSDIHPILNSHSGIIGFILDDWYAMNDTFLIKNYD